MKFRQIAVGATLVAAALTGALSTSAAIAQDKVQFFSEFDWSHRTCCAQCYAICKWLRRLHEACECSRRY